MEQSSKRVILGLTGSLGSGCTTLSRALEEKGFKRVSISRLIKERFRKLHQEQEPTQASYGPDWRAELQDIGNRGRQGKFAPDGDSKKDFRAYWVELALSNAEPEKGDVVVDGIRNMAHPVFAYF